MESQQATSEGGTPTTSAAQSPQQQIAGTVTTTEGLQVVTPQGMQTLQPLAPVSFGDGPPVAMPMMQVPLMSHILQVPQTQQQQQQQQQQPQQGQLIQVSMGQDGQQQAHVVASMAGTQPYMTVAQGSPLISHAQVLPQGVQMVGGVPMMVGIQQQQEAQGSPHLSQDSQGQAIHTGNSTPSPAPQGSVESAPPTPGSIGSPAPQMQMADGTLVPAPTAAMQVPLYAQNMMGHQGQLPPGYLQAQQAAQAQLQAQQAAQAQQQAKLDQEAAIKNLKPPKKPLTPYMRFSKSIWQQVKATHQSLSVCEIGATIGKMWRELSDEQKQKYNEDFTRAKQEYDVELQQYLKITGLQASDLVKSKGKKKKNEDSRQHQQQQQQHHHQAAAAQAHVNQMPPNPFVAGGQPMGNFPGNINGPVGFPQGNLIADPATGLPHFQQVWAGQQGQPAGAVQVAFAEAHAQAQAETQQQQQQQQQQQVGKVLLSSQSPHSSTQSPGEQQQQQAAGAAVPASQAAVAWQWHAPLLQAVAHAHHQVLERQAAAAQSGEAPPPAHQPAAQDPRQENGDSQKDNQMDTKDDQVQGKGEGNDSNNPSREKQEGGNVSGQVKAERPNGPSAHNQFNSYAYNPWGSYPAHAQFNEQDSKVGSRESALASEVQHLRSAVSEKTKEVQKLTQELEKAYAIIEQMRQGAAAAGGGHAGSPSTTTA